MIKRFLFLAIALLLMHKASEAQSSITVTANGPTSICSGNTLTLTVSSSDPNATYSWTGPNGFTATGSSVSVNNVDVNATGTYNVDATDGSNSGSGSLSVLVNQTPSETIPSSQTFCNGDNVPGFSFSSSTSGTMFSWSYATSSIGLAANGSGNIDPFTAVNETNAPVTAALTVTPTVNGCAGSPQTFNILVNPTPTVNSVSDQPACSGTTTSMISFTSPVSGSSYSWTNDNTSIGLAASGTGNINAFTAINGTSTTAIANIAVTPTANGCTGTTSNFIYAVNLPVTPSISISTTSSTTICAGSPVVFAIDTLNGGSSPDIQWLQNSSVVSEGPSFTANNLADGDVISAVFTSSAYCVTSSTVNSNSISFNVNPIPTVNAVSDQEICNSSTTSTISFTGSVGGATYNWVNNNSSIGLAANGTGDIVAFTASNPGGSSVVSNIIVSPIANGCGGPSQNFNIIVDPTLTPSVSVAANPGTTICPGTAVTFTATPSNGGSAPSYQWTKNGTNVGSNNYIYSDDGLNDNDVIACVLTSNANCVSSSIANSNNTVMSVYGQPVVTMQPADSAVCAGNNSAFSVAASGSSLSYQWYVNSGSGFIMLSDDDVYSGSSTNTLSITGATSGMNVYQYQCVVSGPCTQTATSNAALLTVNAAPIITGQPNDSAICSGGNSAFAISANGTGLSYQWMVSTGSGSATLSDGSLYSGSATSALSITGAAASMNGYQYYCVVSGTCGSGVNSNYATLSINTLPSFYSQPAAATVCAGGSTSFSASATGSGVSTYQWLVNAGSGFVALSDNDYYSGSATSTLTINRAVDSMNGFQYQCQTSGTCSPLVTSNTASLAVNDAPAISVQPNNTTVCSGNNVTFSVLATGTAPTYQWMINTESGFSPLEDTGAYSGTSTGNLLITSATDAVNGYQYQCVISGPCTPDVTSNTVVVSVNDAPAIANNPVNITVCENTSANFTVAATGTNLTYQWQVNSGSGFVDLTDGGFYSGSVTNTLAVSAVTSALSGYAYRCNISGTCAPAISSTSAALGVNIAPSFTSQPSASTICSGGSTSYSVTAAGTGLTYQWQVNTGGGFADITDGGPYIGSGTSTLNIANAPSSMNGYTYICTLSGTCSSPAGSSIPATLIVNEQPAITLQPASTTICNGTNTNYTVSATGTALAYQWQVNTGSGFVNLADNGTYSGSATNTLNLTSAANTMSGYTYQCVISGTCTPSLTSNSTSLTFYSSPVASISATDPTTFCDGGNVTIDASTGLNYSYQWQLNGTNQGSATSSTYTAGAGGNYTVVVTNASGCSVTSNALTVTVNPVPSSPVNVLYGTLAFCAGSNVVLGTNTNSGLTYQWQNNGVAIAGATSLDYTATAAGNYSVVVTENACAATSSAVTVQVNAMPSDSLIVSNPAVICPSSGSLLISSVVVAGQTYQWYENGLALSGATAPQYAATSGGWYDVQISNGGCALYTTSVYVTASALTTPAINQQGSLLSTGSYTTYQWYLNGSAISGATTADYTAMQDGTYTVTVTDANGCTATSTDYTVSDLGVSNISVQGVDVKLYPNPASSVVHIDAPVTVNATIFDLQGKKVLQQDGVTSINISELANGVYILQLYTTDGSLLNTQRLVKNN